MMMVLDCNILTLPLPSGNVKLLHVLVLVLNEKPQERKYIKTLHM